MALFRRVFDFYLHGSIHVALAVYALVRMTGHMFRISHESPVSLFAFFGTIAGYNFVKFHTLAVTRKRSLSPEIKAITALSFFSLLLACYYFLQLSFVAHMMSLIVLVLTILYTLPFFPNRQNARNWAGVKIYIVSLCWVGVTVVLPVINAGVGITTDFWLKSAQRFILVFVLILIFEIVDLSKDDPLLQTVPQQIGVKRTKLLGLLLLVVFYFMELLRIHTDYGQLFVNLALIILTGSFLAFANPQRSRYYSSFWVESIPIVWWLLVVFSDTTIHSY
ncbi:MAG: hypothetical protein EOO51_07595 [Flavobacterium sp.]|nr:MAG: hypothetical protein EOO51_07595 [Flavobacterium sp.]